MKPLDIPRIRRLDLTKGYWRIREINLRMAQMVARKMLAFSLSGMADTSVCVAPTVKFRRPIPFIQE